MQDYVQQVLKSESCDYEVVKQRLQDTEIIRLLHAAMGFTTESGEFMDMLKKYLFYGKQLDRINGEEECGDLLWYCGLAIDVLKTTLDEVQTKNIAKLRIRYPEKFTAENAINRDLKKEREVLEG
jgi:NTP pyrophosphatase (non-canonical NTP hydrolase)